MFEDNQHEFSKQQISMSHKKHFSAVGDHFHPVVFSLFDGTIAILWLSLEDELLRIREAFTQLQKSVTD